MQLRLMDDIVIPRSLAQFSHPDRPPYASSARPTSYSVVPRTNAMQQAVEKSASTASETDATMQATGQPPVSGQTSGRLTILVTKSNQIYEVAKYHRDGELLMFQDAQGRKGGVDVNEVDWRRTTGMTGEVRSADKPLISRQTN